MIEHIASDPKPIQSVVILGDGDTPYNYHQNPGEWDWEYGADDVDGVVAELALTSAGPGQIVSECWHRGDSLWVIFRQLSVTESQNLYGAYTRIKSRGRITGYMIISDGYADCCDLSFLVKKLQDVAIYEAAGYATNVTVWLIIDGVPHQAHPNIRPDGALGSGTIRWSTRGRAGSSVPYGFDVPVEATST